MENCKCLWWIHLKLQAGQFWNDWQTDWVTGEAGCYNLSYNIFMQNCKSGVMGEKILKGWTDWLMNWQAGSFNVICDTYICFIIYLCKIVNLFDEYILCRTNSEGRTDGLTDWLTDWGLFLIYNNCFCLIIYSWNISKVYDEYIQNYGRDKFRGTHSSSYRPTHSLTHPPTQSYSSNYVSHRGK